MRTFLVFLLLVISTVTGRAQPRSDVSLFGYGELNGPMYDWEVSAKQYEAQPRWQPTNPTLPLPIPKAVSAAEAWIKRRNPDVNTFAVSSISVAPMGCCSRKEPDRWYFRIEFNPVVGGQTLFGGHFIAVVLFDGSVVEPRIEQR